MDHWITRAAAMHPERYAQLERRALAFAGGLAERGVTPGERVGVALAGGNDFQVALHGCFLFGVVAAPIDRRLSREEQALRARGCSVVVEELIDGPPPPAVSELRLDAVATLMHTSGTTSTPKPVALTFGNWSANALGSAVALGLDRDERWLCPLPLAHVGGLSILIRSTIYATSVVVLERFDVERVLATLSSAQERVTLVSLVPTMLARLLDAGLRDPPTLRWALLGGAPLPHPLLRRAREAGVPVAPTYGMTEACSQIATHGLPLPGVDVQIADDGEVLVRGNVVAPGALAQDGWLHTGDLGLIDASRRLSIVGRKADTIVTGGENVVPAEVEEVLLEHPLVVDAGVFGRPDPEWGEAVVARVVAAGAVSAQELRDWCRARLAAYKVPKAVELVEALPRAASGKLLRRELLV